MGDTASAPCLMSTRSSASVILVARVLNVDGPDFQRSALSGEANQMPGLEQSRALPPCQSQLIKVHGDFDDPVTSTCPTRRSNR